MEGKSFENVTAKKLKRSKWSDEDNILILELWEVYENELRKTKRNFHVYKKMSQELNGKFNAQEIHTKIRNLSQRYRAERKEIGSSGESPSQWVHYQRVHNIIGSNVTTEVLPQSSSSSLPPSPLFIAMDQPISPTLSTSTISPLLEFPSTLPETPSETSYSKKRKKNENAGKEILINMEKQTEYMKKQTDFMEHQLQLGSQQLQLMQGLREDFSNFLHQQEQSDKAFLEVFKVLADNK